MPCPRVTFSHCLRMFLTTAVVSPLFCLLGAISLGLNRCVGTTLRCLQSCRQICDKPMSEGLLLSSLLFCLNSSIKTLLSSLGWWLCSLESTIDTWGEGRETHIFCNVLLCWEMRRAAASLGDEGVPKGCRDGTACAGCLVKCNRGQFTARRLRRPFHPLPIPCTLPFCRSSSGLAALLLGDDEGTDIFPAELPNTLTNRCKASLKKFDCSTCFF